MCRQVEVCNVGELESQVIIITGAAMGIGAALAAAVVAAGARVGLIDINPAVHDVAGRLGDRALDRTGDVTDKHVIDATVAAVQERFGRIDGLVNNAGLVVNGTALTIRDEEWDRAMAINLTAPLMWIRAVLPHMLAQGSGSIVNVASVIGMRGRANGVAYIAAKAGLIGLTRSVALDFGPRGIRCNAVSPGVVETEMFADYARLNPGAREAMLAKSYTGRLGRGEDIAEACIHFLSSRSSFTNGAELIVDGGMTSTF